MPSGSLNFRSEPTAEEPAGEGDQRAVETFFIDVSAGHRSAVSSRHRRAKKSRARKQVSDSATPNTHESAVDKQGRVVSETKVRRSVKHAAARTPSSGRASVGHSPLEPTRRSKTPSWLLSLAIHATALLVLSFLSLASIQKEEFGLLASAVPQDFIEEIVEIDVAPSVDLESLESELPAELEDPGLASFGELSAESELNDVSEVASLSSNDLGEFGSLFGASGNGLSDLGIGPGGATTSFFGTQAKARHIVFVIDNTGSMNYGGLETVVFELMKTVDALDPRQQFYVLFFSDQVYPLFYPQYQPNFVRATEENKRMLRNWLDTVELCTGGVWQLTQSLSMAYELQPDIVYLLCDGRDWDRVRASYKVEAVEILRTTPNPRGIPVHTLGMGCKTEKDRENLATVARVNSGTFREVKVTPEMIEVARQRNRTYHINGPGEVWGTEVSIRRVAGE